MSSIGSKHPRPIVVVASVLPLGERRKIGVLANETFRFWAGTPMSKPELSWSTPYPAHHVREVRHATAAEIRKSGLRLETWQP